MEKTIIKALKSAGKLLYKNFEKAHTIDVKHDQSNIVTEMDVQAEKIILDIITNKFPSHNIITEEKGYIYNSSEYTWIIDPLDGTSNYATGIPWFGILIALLKNYEPLVAGAYLPVSKDLYLAKKNKGAFKNGEKIKVSGESELKNVLFAYSLDYSDMPQKTEQEAEIIKKIVKNTRNLRATNSLVDFLYTAEGKFGGNINQTTKIWDIAAPYLIITEAGGMVTDIHKKPIDFKVDKSNYNKNFTIVATNKCLHDKIFNII